MTKQIDGIGRVATLTSFLTKALGSGKVHTAAAFILGAIAFVLANLLLARHLAPSAYGLLALVVAIVAAAIPVAPFGLAVIIVRRHLTLDRQLLLRCAFSSILVALGAVALSAYAYSMVPAVLVITAITIFGGGFSRLAAARLQSEERFLVSTLVSESGNYMLLLAALGTLLAGIEDPLWPLAFVCASQILVAGILILRLREASHDTSARPAQFQLSEMLLLTGTNAAIMVLVQLERFAIPIVLDIETLARFAVLAMFTIAPFRPVEVSTYRTLLPRLSRSTGVDERRRLLMRETRDTAFLFVGFGVLIVAVTPALVEFFFSGKYYFSLGTIVAGIMLGQLRVVRSIFSAAIGALADQRGLVLWNLVEWVSVLAAFLGGWAGSTWGLQGFLWGVVGAGVCSAMITLPLVFRATGKSPP